MNYLCANRDQQDGTRPVSVYYNVHGLHDRGFQMMPGQWSPETTKIIQNLNYVGLIIQNQVHLNQLKLILFQLSCLQY